MWAIGIQLYPQIPPKHPFQSEELVRVFVLKDLSCSFCKGCFSYGLPKPIISFIKVLTKQINFNIWCKGRTHVCEDNYINQHSVRIYKEQKIRTFSDPQVIRVNCSMNMFYVWFGVSVLPSHSSVVLTLQVLIVTKINFLLTISMHCQEIWLWELIKWTPTALLWSFIKFSQLIL